MPGEINIPINIPITGVDKALADIGQLETSILKLTDSIGNLPIEIVNKRLTELRTQFNGVQTSAIQLNQAVDGDKIALSSMLQDIENLINKTQGLANANKSLSNTLADTKGQVRGLKEMVDSYNAQLVKCDLTTEKGRRRYDELSGAIVNTKTKLSELNSIMQIQSEEVEKMVGYYGDLQIITKALIEQRDLLIKTEGKESVEVERLTGLIQQNNIALQSNARELNAVNVAEQLLIKNEEALIKIRNQDLDSLIKVSIAQQNLNELKKEGVYNQSGQRAVDEEAAIEKMLLENDKYVSKLDENESKIENLSIKLNLKKIEDNESSIRTMLLENDKYVSKLDENESKIVFSVFKAEAKKAEIRDATIRKMLLENDKAVVKLDEDERKIAFNTFKAELQKAEARSKSEKSQIIASEKSQLAAEKSQLAAEKSIWSWQNFSNVFERMGLRIIASLIWWTAIIGAATLLWELWTKIDEATQIGIDRLKDYFDVFKSNQKAILDATPKTQTDIIFDEEKCKRILANMNRYLDDGNIKKAFVQYKELLNIYPKIFDAMDELEFKENARGERMKSQIETMSKYNILLKERATAEELSKQAILLRVTNKNLQEGTKKNIIDAVRNDDYYKNLLTMPDMTEDRVIQLMQEQYKQKRTELPEKYNPLYFDDKKDLRANVEILNRLQADQIQNQNNERDRKNALDKFAPQIADLEGNEKNPKGRHPKDHSLQEALELERANSQNIKDDIKSNYDDSSRSLNEKISMFQSDNAETKRHYEAQLQILKDYGKQSGESQTKLHARELEFLKEKKDSENKDKESKLQELENLKRFNNEQQKLIEDADRKIQETVEAHQRAVNELELKEKKGSSDLKKAKRWNPLSAFFGGGGGTPVEDWKDEKQKLQDVINKDSIQLNEDVKDQMRLNIKTSTTGEQVRANENQRSNSFVLGSALSPEQLSQFNFDSQENNKNLSDKKQLDAKFDSDVSKATEDDIARKKSIAEHDKQSKIQVAEEIFKATEKIANSAFENQKKRIQIQMQNIQAQADFEMTLAGNNNAAKIRIAKTSHDQLLALKRKEANTEKQEGIFNASISMAEGIAAAWKTGNPVTGAIISALVAAAGLAQIAEISQEPLPAYRKGKRSGEGKTGLARVNEDGFEIRKRGAVYSLLGNGKDSIVPVDKQDEILTHNESSKFLKTLLKGTGVITERDRIETHQRMTAISIGVSKGEFREAMIDAIQTLPRPKEIILPAPGIIAKHQRQQSRHGLTDY